MPSNIFMTMLTKACVFLFHESQEAPPRVGSPEEGVHICDDLTSEENFSGIIMIYDEKV